MTEIVSTISQDMAVTDGASSIVTTASTEKKDTTIVRQRDEVFWTELEIRRLGNIVAECIHARRYVGNTSQAQNERKRMRQLIDAMKRKSMRVLHRAELFAKGSHAAWPGIDPTITDPVSLAEEYVNVVQNYEAVLLEEETQSKDSSSSLAQSGMNGTDEIPAIEEDWEAVDLAAYEEAKKQVVELQQNEKDREQLLGPDAEGIRRRKNADNSGAGSSGKLSKEEEEFMSRHQPIQDELTNNLVELVGNLKESISASHEKLEKDKQIIDETEDAVDKNLSGTQKQQAALKKYTNTTATSWWMIIVGTVIIVLFVFVLVIIKLL